MPPRRRWTIGPQPELGILLMLVSGAAAFIAYAFAGMSAAGVMVEGDEGKTAGFGSVSHVIRHGEGAGAFAVLCLVPFAVGVSLLIHTFWCISRLDAEETR